jgi:hypothetical protein
LLWNVFWILGEEQNDSLFQGMKSLMRAVRLLEQIEQRDNESVCDYFDRTSYLFNASAVDFLTDLKGGHAPGFLAHHQHMLLVWLQQTPKVLTFNPISHDKVRLKQS